MSAAAWLEAAGREAVRVLCRRGGARRVVRAKRYTAVAATPIESLEQRLFLSSAPAAFLPQVTFAAGQSLRSVTTADVNGDGKPDLIAADIDKNNVDVLLGNGDGTFKPQATFAAGNGPRSVVVADINRDGKLDLIVVDGGGGLPGDVSVLLGNGDGTFHALTTFAAGGTPYSITAADVNGDGKLDVIVTNEIYPTPGTVSVLLGNGDGTFGAPTSFASGSYCISITAADVNDDGKPDLIVANEGSEDLSVMLGNGDGTFQPRTTLATGVNPFDVITADVNGDGKPDLLVSNDSSNDISVLLGNGDGSFKNQTTVATGTGPTSIVLADVNGDGKLDLIAANYDVSYSFVSVILGNGDGTFQPQVFFATAAKPYAVTGADVNGDGRPDLIVGSEAGGISLLLGDVPPKVQSINRSNPSGSIATASSVTFAVTFSKPVTGVDASDFAVALTGSVTAGTPSVSGSGAAYTVTIGNITGVGTLGLNLLDNGSIVDSLGVPLRTASIQPQATFAAGSSPVSLVLADVNRDGNPDLIDANSGSSDTVSVLLGNSNGTFKSPATLATTGGATSVTSADVNGDGKPDLLAVGPNTSNSNTATLLLGNGDGTFQAGTAFAAGPAPAFVTTADLNSDGKLDFIAVTPSTNAISIRLNNGSGGFLGLTTFAAGSSPASVAVADVNHDGKLDLVVANEGGATASVLLGNGNGTFQSQITFATGSAPASIALADVNRDGKLDLITANSAGNTISVLLGNGNGTFGAQHTFATSAGPSSVAVADTNNDGKLDLVVANKNSNSTGILLGNGDGTFQPQVTFAAGTGPSSIAVADVNRDGSPDLLTTNSASNNVSVLAGNAAATFVGQAYTIAALHFDFGTATSPVAAGYTRVSESTAYSATQGYGWQTAPLGSRDRGAVAGTTALTQDFDYTGTAGSTFAVNLPSGVYNVTVTTGDATTKRDNQGIFLEGTQVDSITTAAGQFVARTYAVAVSDGQLNVQLKDLGGNDPYAVIDGLDIATYSAHFDFGTPTSPVAGGYTRVSEATLLSGSASFGWLAAPVGSRDRGAISGTTALTEDFDYTSTGGSTFAVNLPNGSYNVTVTMGDATTKRDDQGIYLEGTLKDTVTTKANQYFIKTYAVTVINNQLTLLLKDLGGNDPYSVIDGLDIVGT